MIIGVIADDFTGASDIANTFAKGLPGEGGLRTAQCSGVPQQDAPPDIDVGVIALKSRSIPVGEAVEQSMHALAWLRRQGCRQIIFKYCSTFDSTPLGNIGPVAEALAQALDAKGVVVCPSFPANGRTLYLGHLFVHGRLLSESGMQHHPVTPMTDPDIRRWLDRQTNGSVGHAPLTVVREGHQALSQALQEAAVKGTTLVVVDAITDADLITIGNACAHAPLITGGSGVAMGLPRKLIETGAAKRTRVSVPGVSGPAAILSGSCSAATQAQIRLHQQSNPTFEINAEAVLDRRVSPKTIADFLSSYIDEVPLAYSSATPERVRELQQRCGADVLAHALDRFFAETARLVVARGIRRLVVAGGETSGAVVSELELEVLLIGPEIDPGVPVLYSRASGLALALKSGNFGGPDFFGKAVRIMGGGQVTEGHANG